MHPYSYVVSSNTAMALCCTKGVYTDAVAPDILAYVLTGPSPSVPTRPSHDRKPGKCSKSIVKDIIKLAEPYAIDKL